MDIDPQKIAFGRDADQSTMVGVMLVLRDGNAHLQFELLT